MASLNLAEFETRAFAGESVNQLLGHLFETTQNPQIEKLRTLVWQVGCSTEEVVEVLKSHQEFAEQLRSQADLAAHSAKVTSRITLAMPWITAVLCQLSGLPVVTSLIKNSIGWLILCVAAMLTWSASYNSKKIISACRTVPPDEGFDFTLAALALKSGMSQVQVSKVFSVPRKSLLEHKHQAALIRLQARNLQQKKLAALPQKLIINTGLLVLPATFLVTLSGVTLAGVKSLM